MGKNDPDPATQLPKQPDDLVGEYAAPVVTDREIADHRALVDYLKQTSPNYGEDDIRRYAARIVVDPNGPDRDLLDRARKHAAPAPQSDPYLQDTERRLTFAHRRKNVVDPYYVQTARRLMNSSPLEDSYRGSDYDEQQRIQREQWFNQHPDQQPTHGAPQRQAPVQQKPDPQLKFLQTAAPLAARLVRQTGLDPMSAALISAQLYGARPYTDQLSEAEITAGVNQALHALTNQAQGRTK